ncbi:MAG: PAS domain S-box protein, partial [Actinomycetota bacterium]|nr:PAS domain S-box protein [Actinomycetota bacterium]
MNPADVSKEAAARMHAGSDGSRRGTGQPGARWGVYVALLAVAVPVFMTFAAVVHGVHGIEEWESWVELVLVALSLLGVVVSWVRARLEADRHWGILVIALGFLAFRHCMLSLDASTWLSSDFLSWADIGQLGFIVSFAVFMALHVRVADRTQLLVHLLDALLVTLATMFVLWEVVIAAAVPDLSRLSATTQFLIVFYPTFDVFVVSLMVLAMLTDRSPGRITVLFAMLSLAVADTLSAALAGGLASVSDLRFTMMSAAWVLGVVLLIAALALPAGKRMSPHRPGLARLILVHGSVTAGLWMATWRHLVQDTRTTATSVVIGALTGLVWSVNQVAVFRQSGRWADRLRDNIVELEHAQGELRQLLDDLPNAVVVLSGDGRIREANANVAELTGRSHEDLLGRYFTELFHDEHRHVLVDLWKQLRLGVSMRTPTLPFDRPDGRQVLLEADANLPLRDPERVVIALRDVTDRVAEALRLEKARERFRLAFHGAPTGMALSSAPGGVLLDVNDSLVRMLGRSRDDLVGRTVEEISHPDDWRRSATLLQRASDHEFDNYRIEKRYIRDDGGVVWARTWVSVMDDGEGGTLAIAHIEDVTEQRHHAERLEWAATHDGLTGLPNRFRFLERLGAYLESTPAGSIAVLFIDIDNFKVINDSLGHDAGDQLLQAMSERLRTVVRDRDMLGRFGGD